MKGPEHAPDMHEDHACTIRLRAASPFTGEEKVAEDRNLYE